MSNISREQLKKLHQKLPEDIARIYESEETTRAILDIGRKHGLAIDTIGRMSSEIGYVIIGAKPAREFVGNLESALGIPREKAVLIAREINARIFASIRENLKRLHGIGPASPLIDETEKEKPHVLHPEVSEPLQPISYNLQANAKDLSDRAYWEAVKTADGSTPLTVNSEQWAVGSGQEMRTADTVMEENDRGTLIQIQKQEAAKQASEIKTELAKEVSKLLTKREALEIAVESREPQRTPPNMPVQRTAGLAAPIATPVPEEKKEPTSSQSTIPPANPPSYGKDPYREPIEN